MFMTMGLPKVLTTDQGTDFKNALNDELMMKRLKIKHHLITSLLHITHRYSYDNNYSFFEPSYQNIVKANGLDERFNQTLQRMLVKFSNGTSKDL